MIHSSLNLECIVSQPFEENTYLAYRAGSTDCLIIDPGMEPEKFAAVIKEKSLNPVAILNTHGHSDHIAGNGFCKQHWPDCPLIIGEGDEPKLTDAQLNLSAPFGVELISPSADQTVREGDSIDYAGIKLEVLETPGHSCGHVVFVWKDASPYVVFGGDVLFNGSIGRTDFPDGSMEQLASAIHGKLFTLPGDTIVLPGHGPATTVEQEIRMNPFVGAPAGYQPRST